MDTYFTSDTHFGHEKIIEYCQRPFRSLYQMDEVMVERWNETVQPGDLVYHLGDFAFGSVEKVENYRNRLNGRIILIQGNHDRIGKETLRRIFDEVHKTLIITTDHGKVYMSHSPADLMESFSGFRLNGHVHDRWRYGASDKRQINVGVDQWEFRPRRLVELTDWSRFDVSGIEL